MPLAHALVLDAGAERPKVVTFQPGHTVFVGDLGGYGNMQFTEQEGRGLYAALAGYFGRIDRKDLDMFEAVQDANDAEVAKDAGQPEADKPGDLDGATPPATDD